MGWIQVEKSQIFLESKWKIVVEFETHPVDEAHDIYDA